MSSFVGVSSLYQTAPTEKPLGRAAAQGAPALALSSCCFLRASARGRALVAAAIATPNSVLSEEAFKGLQGRSLTKGPLGSESEDDEGGFGEDDEDYPLAEDQTAGRDELAISSLGLPQQLVDSLQKRGITHLFPIQVLKCFTFFSPDAVACVSLS